jgi:hypothetical protein
MNGTSRYRKLLVNSMSSDLKLLLETHSAELNKVVFNQLLDEPGPRTLSRTPRRSEVFRYRLFEGFIHLHDALEVIRDVRMYMRRAPFTGVGVTPLRYFRYTIESFLHQVYVFHERLRSYLTVVERCYRSDSTASAVKRTIEYLRQVVQYTFKEVLDLRGRHVHERPFEPPDLARLGSLELMTTIIGAPEGSDFFRAEFRRIRREWVQSVERSVAELEKLLDITGEALAGVLDDGSGSLIVPPNHR